MRKQLELPPSLAKSLGRSAVEAAEFGYYLSDCGKVDWKELIQTACRAKVSIPPDAYIPLSETKLVAETRIHIANETKLSAGKRLVDAGFLPLALNFANGVETVGGFLRGATAQEESLCRSSALFQTLSDDPMYDYHRNQLWSEASSWTIQSPLVPVFRIDDGSEHDASWLISFATCAAPYTSDVGQPRSGDLLGERIRRVLLIANAYGYRVLVLGAWCLGMRNSLRTRPPEWESSLRFLSYSSRGSHHCHFEMRMYYLRPYRAD